MSRRTTPTIKDIIRSCEELGVGGVTELTDELEGGKAYVARAYHRTFCPRPSPLNPDPPVPADTPITYDKIRKAEERGLTLDSDSEDDDPADAAAIDRKRVV